MRNNAMKTVREKDSYLAVFPWSDKECNDLGVERAYAHLAWLVVCGYREKDALALTGWEDAPFEIVSVSPKFLHAMRVLGTQYLNAVAFPKAIRTLVAVAEDRHAAAAARVNAAGKLLDHSASLLAALKGDMQISEHDMTPEMLERVIAQMQASQVDLVQSAVQSTQQADYLSDMS